MSENFIDFFQNLYAGQIAIVQMEREGIDLTPGCQRSETSLYILPLFIQPPG